MIDNLSIKAYPDIEKLVILRDILDVTLDDQIINDNIIRCKNKCSKLH